MKKAAAKILLHAWGPTMDSLLSAADTPKWRLYVLMKMGTALTQIMTDMVRRGEIGKESFPELVKIRDRITALFKKPPTSLIEIAVSLYDFIEKSKKTPKLKKIERELLSLVQSRLHAVIFTPPPNLIGAQQATDDLKDFHAFVYELNQETDRGAALVGATLIDSRLKQLLAAHILADDTSQALIADTSTSALSTFSSRIKACHALGLITRAEHDECQIIRGIRNDFAHKLHGLSFATQSISDRCKNLKGGLPMSGTPRQQFIDAVIILCMVFWYRPAHAEQFRATPRRWPWQLLRDGEIQRS